MRNLKPKFSHIYIEKDAIGYPLTDIALSKFHRSTVLEIDHYKDIFNRPGQDFQIQKSSMKLILAKKKEPYIYPASEMVQDYNTPNVYYNTPMLNCLYNCDYCYLQGMYDSGNLVVFVNEDDMMDAIDNKIANPIDPSKPTVVSISYNTDLLAMENIFPLTRRWINYINGKGNAAIEIRTKSSLFHAIKDIKPSDNVILSWTLSPEIICARYESTAPPLNKRVEALKNALDSGWQIRICFDPIILIDGWFETYSEFINKLFQEVDVSGIRDITLGVFRMNKDYFNKIRKRDPRSDIFFSDYAIENNIIVVDKEKRISAIDKLENILRKFLSKDKILTWK